ncbi:MAG: hypothetical protein QF406_14830, partial [Verrucomicrobiota bacterium]|nr:hypothetical protein [Verrucomicrobiota bacterium]
EGSEGDGHMQEREDKAHPSHHLPEFLVAVLVTAERSRGGEQHDDGRLNHQCEWEDDTTVGRQMDGGIFEARNDGAQKRELRTHENPAGGQGEPCAEDQSLIEGFIGIHVSLFWDQ